VGNKEEKPEYFDDRIFVINIFVIFIYGAVANALLS